MPIEIRVNQMNYIHFQNKSYFGNMPKIFFKRPKFSVIVTSYNYERYIGETINSLKNQTDKNFEVIIFDDGSSDKSISVISKLISDDSRFKLFCHKDGKNHGLSETIKKSVSLCHGEYICFCESDDCWTQNHIQILRNFIKHNKNAGIILNWIQILGDINEEKKNYLSLVKTELKDNINKINVYEVKFNVIPTFSAVCVKKSIMKRLNFNSQVIPAWLDWWLWRQVLRVHPLYFVNDQITIWRIHDSFNSQKKYYEYAKKEKEFLEESNAIITKKINFFKKIFNKLYYGDKSPLQDK